MERYPMAIYICDKCGRPFNGWKAGKEHEASCLSTRVDDELDQQFREEGYGQEQEGEQA